MKGIHCFRGAFLGLFLCFLLSVTVLAQNCSTLNPCATGCCNKGGYCGIGDDYCGADCVASCDYQPECDASRPCAQGCCNKYGYCGLGKDFCAKDVCVGNCDRKSECDPGNYGDYAEASKCPLNVCCSKFGFCGTTDDFCGKKKVKRPSCPKDNSLNRVVGYYEGWSPQRGCHVFYPEQIPMGIYTHLNYAFATIDPKTFEVLPGSDYEKKLMTRLTDLKKIDPDLKVFVAVGGWTFNDPGATQKVFSDLASSESNQRKFFKSLSSFLSTYNFDGIDLDWEYPVADDRGGRTSDFKNFPKFMANLKTAMKSWGGRDGLSITLPASYWYLQHFDIANLQKHVDFFNIMTYDIHGKWDLGNEWLAPVLNSHTNLTEITIAMDLLWRNDIKPEKVVMGLAFYARVFAAADISCMDAGCPFASGGNPGKCSNEVSILLNSEIMDIMDKQKLQSTLDKKAAVKILKFDDNQWLTYDNQETFQLKADFARSQCLGGVMVWAVSHDLPSGNFSRVLGEVIGREVTSLQYDKTKDSLKVTKNHLQCRWSNCGDDCPSGWSRIRRTDKGARGGEHMWDNTGCAEGQHTFCCPPDAELPKCGWYTHNNGNCDSECPSGYVEVGSNFQHCSNNKNDYQAACCTTDTSSMKLYSQCDWAGDAPKCGKGQCKDSQSVVALSTTGSGGNYCNPSSVTYTLTGQDATYEERKYCCDQDDNVKWSDCQWYDALGISESVFQVIGFCDNNCPSDRVRVALDQHGGDCKGDGGRAKCCIAKYSTVSKRSYTDSESQMESNLKDFMDDPRCGLDDYSFKRDLAGMDLSSGNISFSGDTHSISNLRRRASTKSMDVVLSMAYSIYITYDATAAIQEMWQRNVVSVYTHLTVETVRAFMLTAEDYYSRGSWNFVLDLVCNMGFMNARVGDIDPIRCDCDTPDCCDPNDSDSCAEDADADFITKRQLEKRARNNEVELNDGNGNIVIVSWPYQRRGEIGANDPILNAGYEYDDLTNCLNIDISNTQIPLSTIGNYQIEHIVELNTIADFLRDAHAGVLSSGATARNGRLSATFVRQALDAPILNNPPVMAGGDQSSEPILRVMHALGSTRNRADFTLLLSRLNNVKSRVWRAKVPPTSGETIEPFIAIDNPRRALVMLREPLTILAYLNHPVINTHIMTTANIVREEWGRADDAWEATGQPMEYVQDWWDEWIRDRLKYMAAEVRKWVEEWAKKMSQHWAVRTGVQAKQVNEILASLRRLASDAEVDHSGLD